MLLGDVDIQSNLFHGGPQNHCICGHIEQVFAAVDRYSLIIKKGSNL